MIPLVVKPQQISLFLHGLILKINHSGEMPERSNGTVSKTVVLVTVPWVRIPLSPHTQLPFTIKRVSGTF